jgi:hypothetical protein
MGRFYRMTDKAKGKPELSPAGQRKAVARQDRLAAALRANLGRRKVQARERAEGLANDDPAAAPTWPPSPSPGEG